MISKSNNDSVAEPHTCRIWEFLYELAELDGWPYISFFIVILASGKVCGCLVSPMTTMTTTVSYKHGDLSHVGLVNIKVHFTLITLDIRVNWQFQNKKLAYQCHIIISRSQSSFWGCVLLVFSVTRRKNKIKTIERKQSRIWDIIGD